MLGRVTFGALPMFFLGSKIPQGDGGEALSLL